MLRNKDLGDHVGKEIGDVEISKGPEECAVCFFESLEEEPPTIYGVLILFVTEGFYIVYTKPTELQKLNAINKEILYQHLKRCEEEDYEFYFNGPFQRDVGYLLDGLIYVFDLGDKVFTLNPITDSEFCLKKKNNSKIINDFFRTKP